MAGGNLGRRTPAGRAGSVAVARRSPAARQLFAAEDPRTDLESSRLDDSLDRQVSLQARTPRPAHGGCRLPGSRQPPAAHSAVDRFRRLGHALAPEHSERQLGAKGHELVGAPFQPRSIDGRGCLARKRAAARGRGLRSVRSVFRSRRSRRERRPTGEHGGRFSGSSPAAGGVRALTGRPLRFPARPDDLDRRGRGSLAPECRPPTAGRTHGESADALASPARLGRGECAVLRGLLGGASRGLSGGLRPEGRARAHRVLRLCPIR